MRALLLAAGYGTRLRPWTDAVPKCLVPIRGKPLLGYWLDLLVPAGVGPLIVNLHFLPEQVRAFLEGSPHGNRVIPTFEERLLGTAGTILRNKALLQDGAFMVVHVDNLSKFDVGAFQRRHASRPAECEMTMMTFDSPTPESSGVLGLDPQGIVRSFTEKPVHPSSCLANGAVYILEPSIFPFLEGLGKTEIDFSSEVIPEHLGKIWTFHNDVYHRDIGTPGSYAKAQTDDRYLLED